MPQEYYFLPVNTKARGVLVSPAPVFLSVCSSCHTTYQLACLCHNTENAFQFSLHLGWNILKVNAIDMYTKNKIIDAVVLIM